MQPRYESRRDRAKMSTQSKRSSGPHQLTGYTHATIQVAQAALALQVLKLRKDSQPVFHKYPNTVCGPIPFGPGAKTSEEPENFVSLTIFRAFGANSYREETKWQYTLLC